MAMICATCRAHAARVTTGLVVCPRARGSVVLVCGPWRPSMWRGGIPPCADTAQWWPARMFCAMAPATTFGSLFGPAFTSIPLASLRESIQSWGTTPHHAQYQYAPPLTCHTPPLDDPPLSLAANREQASPEKRFHESQGFAPTHSTNTNTCPQRIAAAIHSQPLSESSCDQCSRGVHPLQVRVGPWNVRNRVTFLLNTGQAMQSVAEQHENTKRALRECAIGDPRLLGSLCATRELTLHLS